MVFVRMLSKLLRDKEIGELVVPIVPDEARTFGMEALFRAVGIYSHVGQRYEPVDMDTLLYYKEAKDGQILEEGITEAGSMSSFIAAGTAYATHGVNTIPFFIYYSMFGFQRVGDLIWAAADSRARGFLLGGTAGRTTLAGEGLQHQDGNSHVLFALLSQLRLLRSGLRLRAGRDHPGRHPPDVSRGREHLLLPDGDERAVRDAGDARRRRARASSRACIASSRRRRQDAKLRAQLFGSGAILNEVVKAQEILQKYGVAADVWSVTSYRSSIARRTPASAGTCCIRASRARVPYVTQCLKDAPGVFVAASDYLKVLPDSIDRWMPRKIRSLGTDGFGRSEDRQSLRDFFEVDARFVALATLSELLEGRAGRGVGRPAGDQGSRHQPEKAESGRELRTDRRRC